MRISLMNQTKDNFITAEFERDDDLLTIITNKTYSLGIFENNHRTNENFRGSHYVGLDFDEGMTLEEAKFRFSKYHHIIATSKSHQKEKKNKRTGAVKPPCDRFRVILKTEKYIDNPDDFKATVSKLMEVFPDADPQCKDAARFFYASPEVVSYKFDGETIPVVKYEPPKNVPKKDQILMKGELARTTLEFIAFAPESKSSPGSLSNAALFKAAVDLHEQGYTKDEAIEILEGPASVYEGLTENDIKTIGSAFNRDPKHPPRKVESCFNFQHPSELSKKAENVSWLVDGLLIQGGISMFAGNPKSGKSTITRQLAMAVSRGNKFFGRDVKKGNVLYLALEEQENLIGAQLKNLGLTKEDNILMHVGPLGAGNVNDNLRTAIGKLNSSLVIIDTLLLFSHFDNLNDYNETYKVISNLRNIARETETHIILIHHKNKNTEASGSNSVLGSTALQGAIDSTIILSEIGGRELYRKLNTYQRGGKRFSDQLIKYDPQKDIYTLSDDKDIPF